MKFIFYSFFCRTYMIHNLLFHSSPHSPPSLSCFFSVKKTSNLNWASRDLRDLGMSIKMYFSKWKSLLKDLFYSLRHSVVLPFTNFCWSLLSAKFRLQTSRFTKDWDRIYNFSYNNFCKDFLRTSSFLYILEYVIVWWSKEKLSDTCTCI